MQIIHLYYNNLLGFALPSAALVATFESFNCVKDNLAFTKQNKKNKKQKTTFMTSIKIRANKKKP